MTCCYRHIYVKLYLSLGYKLVMLPILSIINICDVVTVGFFIIRVYFFFVNHVESFFSKRKSI
jgi:hypothetical protein